MNPIILFQRQIAEDSEVISCSIPYSFSRVGLHNSLVIPRYGLLPHYKELEYDLELQGSKLINSSREHEYIANFDYYWDIEDLTPKTYFVGDTLPEGQFVVKGTTNSKKFEWKNKMFAPTKRKAIEIGCELRSDSMIHSQEIIYREYVPLETLETGINGMPITNEWRFFFYKEYLLSGGFYWSIAENIPKSIPEEAIDLAYEVAYSVSDKVNFFVVDVAKTRKDRWIVIELNDGCMSGLSENDPGRLYKRLARVLEVENNEKPIF